MTADDIKAAHDKAMGLADDGGRARRRGELDSARAHFCDALALERSAALAEQTQPSRAILLRSAAWLAIDAGDGAEAARLADLGLADPETPQRIHYELQEVAQAAAQMTGADPRSGIDQLTLSEVSA